ncbi:DNA-binding protein [Undibacterium sp. CCC2.1]|nr:DNA-binding protein [Undibacterium sp. CCC2.1]MEB0171787.1 DNA-binding protein [Undibacterium sp. CCC1.1]MEB0175603.1 DNA-binding protein [Undibacterium sp. CCC3.4]MEB0216711.1 DNA-binding protein [Undibacterium sp. 5I2]
MSTTLLFKHIKSCIALALKQCGAAHGRSREAEHSAISPDPLRRPFAEVLRTMPDVGIDADFNCRNEITN